MAALTTIQRELSHMTQKFHQTEIPRRRNSNGTEGGPYIIPPGVKRTYGEKRCETCGRMVEPDRRHPRKGKCQCQYYQRTTTFIDVLQDEYLLKMWGQRNVAWGIAQRPDLVLAAASCKPDSDDLQTQEDKAHLNKIVESANEIAGHRVKANFGTALHKLTHQADRGETLGVVPQPYPADLKAYDDTIKAEKIEWVHIEAFRVYDDWRVAGTVDRIGWYKGRLRVFDIKTGSMFNQMGHAMQLTMYARMIPYLITTDERAVDPAEIDLNIGYIIELPAGKGECRLVPKNLVAGWGACRIAKMVWDARKQDYTADDTRTGSTLADMVIRASTVTELKMLWNNAREMGHLTEDIRELMIKRSKEIAS
jgi:hypothetical protein